MSELDKTHAPKTGGGGRADPRDFKKQLRGQSGTQTKIPHIEANISPVRVTTLYP